MDYTSHTAALFIPIAAALGIVGMILVLWSASRESARPVHHLRIGHGMADLPHRSDLPVGGAPTIGAQRTASDELATDGAATDEVLTADASTSASR